MGLFSPKLTQLIDIRAVNDHTHRNFMNLHHFTTSGSGENVGLGFPPCPIGESQPPTEINSPT